MKQDGTPSECPDCGCVAWHEQEGKINTASERYRCMNCKTCVRWADNVPVPKGLKRVNHEWDYA